ncbi:MAG: hypothetical protein JSV95_03840 [Gemmatimonadota bacterium]|nr:MAG: hypothetical protein JSV95_03840 [Gemmatimonadota bacterium]
MLKSGHKVTLVMLAGLTAIACSEMPLAKVADSPEMRFKRGGGPKGPPTPNVKIDVEFPAGASGSGYHIYDDGSGAYIDGECGVLSEILASSQDAWLDPDQSWDSSLGCPRRLITFDYSCEVGQPCTPGTNVESSGARLTIGALGDVTSETDVWAFFVPDFCTSGVLFDPADDDATSYARAKLVSAPGASPRQWHVWTAAGSDVAVCRANGKGKKRQPAVYYHLPFFLTVTER